MLGTFFTFTPDNITSLLGYIGNFIADATPLLIPVMAVGLGMLVLWGIASIVRGH